MSALREKLVRATRDDAREQVVGTWPFRLVAHPQLRAAGYDRIMNITYVDLCIKVRDHRGRLRAIK